MTTDHELRADRHHHHPGRYGAGQTATQWDWRKVDGRNFITPSQDQGVCQASTAFAVTDAMNAKLRILFHIPLSDPKQILVPDLSAADVFYCGGGSCSDGQDVEQALGYVTTKGVVPAYNIPYKPTGQTCGRGPAELEVRVTRISDFSTHRSQSTMQDAIQSRGPIIATLRAYQDLKTYTGGVYRYNGTAPFLYTQTVSVLGFTPDGRLCKNSWGPNWGSGGVFLIAYGECGIDDEWMWEINGFTTTYPYGTVTAGTPAASGLAPLRLYYRDNYDVIQYLSAYPPSATQPVPLDGIAAASNPAISVGTGAKASQVHVIRTDLRGYLQDNVLTTSWSKVQWLTGPDGFTEGPPAAGNPIAVGGPYVLYRDADGNIHNVYLSGDKWNWQQVTGGAGPKLPAAAGDPQLSEFGGGLNLCYRATDGNIQNLENRSNIWTVRPVTGNPPPAAGDPFVSVYNSVLRVLYRDKDGKIVHLTYDNTKWGWEYLPAKVVAVGDPVSVNYSGYLHLFYRESRGFIWHVYWYGGRWNDEQLTGPGLSGGELAEGDPEAVTFGNEIHVLYRDIYDNLSDAYWTGSTWTHLVRI